MEKVRLIDIARRVGVSSAVVSSVLNGKCGNVRVSEEKRALILSTAVDLHYSPDLNALALAGKPTRVIGVLVDSQCPQVTTKLTTALEAEAAAHEMRILLGITHDNAQDLFKTYQHLRQHGVDGIICISHDYPEHNDEIGRFFANTPNLVMLSDPCIVGCPTIIPALDHGVREAVRHLRSRGRNNIIFLLNAMRDIPDYFSTRLKLKGFLDECPGGENAVIRRDITPENVHDVLMEVIQTVIIPRRINGVLMPMDTHAMALISALQKFGLRVPDDIGVIGFDNDDLCQFTMPPLTTIDNDNKELARVTFNTLLELLNGHSPESPVIRVNAHLVVRQST